MAKQKQQNGQKQQPQNARRFGEADWDWRRGLGSTQMTAEGQNRTMFL